jgi:AcrR family transcriptional regulator
MTSAPAERPRRKGAGSRDGRSRRGEQNRAQIVEAIVSLIRAGEQAPTAEQIALHAGVGTRTLFRHFADMEGLYSAVGQRVGREVLPMFESACFEGGTRARARALLVCRSRIFETIAPFRRRQTPQEARSSSISAGTALFEERLRRQLEEALGPELAACDVDRREALDALLSWESWNRLRTTRRLGGKRVVQLLEEATLALLGEARKESP